VGQNLLQRLLFPSKNNLPSSFHTHHRQRHTTLTNVNFKVSYLTMLSSVKLILGKKNLPQCHFVHHRRGEQKK
jgi:hypothetical protein